jgi:hypothetical protein
MFANADKEMETLRKTVGGKFSSESVTNDLITVSFGSTLLNVYTLTATKIIEQLVRVEVLCNRSLPDKLKARNEEKFKEGSLADSVSDRLMNLATTLSRFSTAFHVCAIAF